MAMGERRVRRPRDKENLIQILLNDGGFPTIRDVLLFTAALGYQRGRREPFDATGEPIRWDTLVDPRHASTLTSMIAAASAVDDPEILAAEEDKEKERIRILEEYANGGLAVLQGEINQRKEPIDQICLSLVTDAMSESTSQRKLPLDSLVDELSW